MSGAGSLWTPVRTSIVSHSDMAKTEGKWPKHVVVRTTIAGILIVALTTLYLLRPDFAQALHWWPMAVWTPFIALPFATFRPRPVRKASLICLAVWFVAVIGAGEPSWRFILPAAEVQGLRVVSLNCAGGTAEAAMEAFSVGANVVLLQEVAAQPEFDKVAKSRGYVSAAFGPDAAIYVQHDFRYFNASSGIDFARAEVELGRRRLKVVSLRLQPPVFRLDWYSPDCWRTYSDDLKTRRERVAELASGLGDAFIIGGDFNTTNPTTFRSIPATEAHRASGRGWPGTGTNDFPLVRVDQIWGSNAIAWKQAYVQKTMNSDHRMVIADFELIGEQ